MGTTQRTSTEDVQGDGKINHQLCCSCLESKRFKYAQNGALRIATGCHKIPSIDHLHAEAKRLNIRENSGLLSAQYLVRCLEPENFGNSINTRDPIKDR